LRYYNFIKGAQLRDVYKNDIRKKGLCMKCTAYYEENEIITYDKYEVAVEKLSASEEITREVYVRKAMFRVNNEQMAKNSRVSFSICMKNNMTNEIYLEKKTNENRLVFKSFTRINKKEAERILNGDYKWMKSSRKALLQDFYLESEINQLKLVSIIDSVKDVCSEIRGLDGIVFKTSYRSCSVDKYTGQFFDENLPMSDVLNCDNVLYSYRRYVHIPNAVSSILHIQGTTKNAVAYSL